MTTGMKGTGATGHASVTGGTEFCKSCLKAGCQVCRAVEGGEDCAFCEDGELCPTRQRIAERAKAAHISERAFRTQTTDVKKENGMHQCDGCEREFETPRGLSKHRNAAHGEAAEKKSGGRTQCRSVNPRPAKKDDGPKLPKAIARAAAAAAVCATIQVTEAALNSWWSKLDVQGKADAFTNAMVLG